MSHSKDVTVCTIACNAEDTISNWFNYVYPRFKHAVIVTSESDDNTEVIAANFASVRPEIFTHISAPMSSFAEHKQLSLDNAPTEWKLILDADEIMEDYDWDDCVKHCPYDVVAFPRYNLQKDKEHYHKGSYPDYQFRLVNSNVRYNSNRPVHETLDFDGAYSELDEVHIIHWGHIRSQQNLQTKSEMRKKFALWDAADGTQLLKINNWFAERNEQWNKDIKKLPKHLCEMLKLYS